MAKLDMQLCLTVGQRPAGRQKCGQCCNLVKKWCNDNWLEVTGCKFAHCMIMLCSSWHD